MKTEQEIKQAEEIKEIKIALEKLNKYNLILKREEILLQNQIDKLKDAVEDIIMKLKMHVLINEHDWSRNPQAQLKDFIESLNKRYEN